MLKNRFKILREQISLFVIMFLFMSITPNYLYGRLTTRPYCFITQRALPFQNLRERLSPCGITISLKFCGTSKPFGNNLTKHGMFIFDSFIPIIHIFI